MRKRSIFSVGQVLFIVIFLRKAESQVTITPHFSSPVRVLEGQPLTLEWTYSIQGSLFQRLEFGISGAAVHIVEAFYTGNLLILDDRVSVNITATNGTITFRTTDRNDSNDYTLVVFTFGNNSGTSDVKIIVDFKAEIVGFVANATTVCQNDVVSFNCSAVGNPAVDTYLLYVNGVVIDSNRFGYWRRSMTTGGVLNFTCVANNTLGYEMRTVAVNVNVSSFIEPISNEVISEGVNLTLSCHATGIPVPTVFWVKTSNGQHTNGTELVFGNISRNESGEYRCEAWNPCGNASEFATIDVQFKAEIVDFVAIPTSVCKNDVVTFNCSAVGNPAVHTYLLYVNGVLNDSNRFGYWSRAMTTGGVHNFTCVANNTFGTDRRTVDVTVNVSSFIEPISNEVITEGGNLTLSCQATGIPPPTVVWGKISNGLLIHGNELVFRNVSRREAGEYRCEASNPCGNATESAIIDVQYPPEGIQLHVSEDEVCNGTTISFNCSAETANPMELNYRLYENNVMIGINTSTGVWDKRMTVGGVFIYRCIVSNSVGTALSSAMSVYNVNGSSSIQTISDKVIQEGSNVTLFCNASGIPEPIVSWINVRNDQRTRGRVLAFENITRYQAGEYRCEASNPCRNATESATIDVHFEPEIIQLVPSETTACLGDSITFNCSANSNPAVHTYRLYVNGIMVNETSTTGVWNRIMTTRGEFVYNCMVNNSVGTAMSTNVTITVNVPSVIQPIDNEVIIEGGNVTLTCNASGFPTPTVSWVKTSNGQLTNGTELVLTSISRDQAGEYRCEASNLCNTATELATVDVQFKPEMVVLDPSATTVCRGDIIVFSCLAYSNPQVHTYELYVNGTMVNEIGRMGIWNITMATGGVFDYKCMVNNTIGTAMSMNVSVTVNEPSSIDPFTNKKIIEGETLTIMCVATGTLPLTVSWVKTSDEERTNGTELVFTYINRIEAGEYRCEASNLCGNASESVEIDVLFEPEMVLLFASKATVCNGSSVILDCSAYGNPVVHTYHLYENGSMVGEISSTGVWTRTMSTGGEFVFACMVNNTVGTAKSPNVSVIVNGPSSIMTIKGNKTLTEGANLSLSCQATGDPLPFVSWIKVDSGQLTDSSDLELTNIQRNQSGEYRCNASNPCNVDTKVVTVDVQYQPVITHISEPQTVNRGNVVTLNCTADGNPAASVRWTRLSDNSNVNMPLAISGKEDAGIYRCIASNGIGSVVTRDTSIVVNFAAVIVPLVDRIIVEKGDDVTLFCNASGMPPPSVMWTFVPKGRKQYSDTWLITDIQVTNLGEYRCDANNAYGHATDSVTIEFEVARYRTRTKRRTHLNFWRTRLQARCSDFLDHCSSGGGGLLIAIVA
ncbi:hemicentin-1-like [Montipora capricornis]|uniref:hemicentin-1-like n=1 Tax=Montipora capricornis TaxID=246305 RepID=UPI0035F1C724